MLFNATSRLLRSPSVRLLLIGFHSVQQFGPLRSEDELQLSAKAAKKNTRGLAFTLLRSGWSAGEASFSCPPPKERPNAIVSRIISWNLHLISTIAQTNFVFMLQCLTFATFSVKSFPLWRISRPEFSCFFRLLWRRRIFKMLCKYSLAVWKIRDHKILSSYYVAR